MCKGQWRCGVRQTGWSQITEGVYTTLRGWISVFLHICGSLETFFFLRRSPWDKASWTRSMLHKGRKCVISIKFAGRFFHQECKERAWGLRDCSATSHISLGDVCWQPHTWAGMCVSSCICLMLLNNLLPPHTPSRESQTLDHCGLLDKYPGLSFLILLS